MDDSKQEYDYYLYKTHKACPEKYEVYSITGEHIGDIALRYGELEVYSRGRLVTVFYFEDKVKGAFDDQDECDSFIREALAFLSLDQRSTADITYIVVDDLGALNRMIYEN